jgi:hypothetical protein
VYEGEWVDDEPRCGVYRAPNPEEEVKFREPSIVRESFNLPELGLKNAQSVVDMAKSETRVMNATLKGMAGGEAAETADTGPFQELVMRRAKELFSALSDRHGGTVILMLLGPVLAELLGFDVVHEDLMDLCAQLEIDPHTPISFPDIVDIAVFIRGNEANDYGDHK